MSTGGPDEPPRRRSGGVTGLGAAAVVLVIAGGMAIPAGDDADPARCRGETKSQSPPLVTLAGLRGCGAVAGSAVAGTVRYDPAGQCFVLDPAGSPGPALLVWPDGSRPVGTQGQAVLVPDRSAGDGLRGGTVAVGDTVEGVGPALARAAVDRVSGGCRSVVGDRVVAYQRLRVSSG